MERPVKDAGVRKRLASVDPNGGRDEAAVGGEALDGLKCETGAGKKREDFCTRRGRRRQRLRMKWKLGKLSLLPLSTHR